MGGMSDQTEGFRRRLDFVLKAIDDGREPRPDWRTAIRDVVAELDDIVSRAERMKAAGLKPALDDVDSAQLAMGSLTHIWLTEEESEALWLGEATSAPGPESVLIRGIGVLCYDGVPISGPVESWTLLTNVVDGEVVEDRPALPPSPTA